MRLNTVLSTLVTLLVVLLVVYFFPWRNVNWGGFDIRPGESVTVSGYAESNQTNQMAVFTAGVNATNQDKQAAVDQVNSTMEEIIASVKQFGVAEGDIKTQSLSIWQYDQYDPNLAGQWRADNSIEIRLRDANRASDLAGLLTSSGATNVWGPNFQLDDTNDAQRELLGQAIQDAREKAEIIAKASNKTLGEVLSVQEGGVVSPVYPMFERAMGGGGGAPVEPGSSTVSQTVTVTFELR